MRYVIRDRESGNFIDEFETLEGARKQIAYYEEQDKKVGTFEEDFYEIYDTVEEEVVY